MIELFVKYILAVRGLSPRTAEEYRKSLSEFAIWAQPQGLRWSIVTKQDIDRWTAEQTEANLAPRTIKARMSALRTFFSWLVHEGKLANNPATWCSTPKAAQNLPHPADLSAIDNWLAMPATSKQEGQIKMLTAIIVETGVRLSEALALTIRDFRDGGIYIKGKGRKERIVFYGSRTMEAIRAYHTPGVVELFNLSPVAARFAMYNTLGKVVPGVHPHQLRHTFACFLLNAGMELSSVSQLLGHSNINTTRIYAQASTNTLHTQYNQYYGVQKQSNNP